MGKGYSNYFYTEGAKKRLVPNDLMKELEESGKKFNKSDVLMITKNYYGKLMWLEKGNKRAGLEHIVAHHKHDLPDRDSIPILLRQIVRLKPIKHVARNEGKQLADVFYYRKNNEVYLVAYGDNGFIVSFYPVTNDFMKGK